MLSITVVFKQMRQENDFCSERSEQSLDEIVSKETSVRPALPFQTLEIKASRGVFAVLEYSMAQESPCCFEGSHTAGRLLAVVEIFLGDWKRFNLMTQHREKCLSRHH